MEEDFMKIMFLDKKQIKLIRKPNAPKFEFSGALVAADNFACEEMPIFLIVCKYLPAISVQSV